MVRRIGDLHLADQVRGARRALVPACLLRGSMHQHLDEVPAALGAAVRVARGVVTYAGRVGSTPPALSAGARARAPQPARAARARLYTRHPARGRFAHEDACAAYAGRLGDDALRRKDARPRENLDSRSAVRRKLAFAGCRRIGAHYDRRSALADKIFTGTSLEQALRTARSRLPAAR